MKSIGRVVSCLILMFLLCACQKTSKYYADYTCFWYHDYIFQFDSSGNMIIVDPFIRQPSGLLVPFHGTYEIVDSKHMFFDNHNTHNDMCFYFEVDGDDWVLVESKSKGYERYQNSKKERIRLEPYLFEAPSVIDPERYK